MKHAPTIDEPIVFPVTDLFFSITDKKGIIRSGNETFVRISGYSRDELLGRPHNIIRHPDMPRAVFKLLWDYIQSDKPISAFVKNRAKDGRYYWVLATVLPMSDGYLSVRMKPSGRHFAGIAGLYAKMLEAEATGDMAAAGQVLHQSLQQQGYESYDEFMAASLREELALGAEHFRDDDSFMSQFGDTADVSSVLNVYKMSARIDANFSEILHLTNLFDRVEKELSTKTLFITTLARDIGYLAAKVDSQLSRLTEGANDEVTGLIDQATEAAESLQHKARLINKISGRILDTTRSAEYLIALASLQIKMLAKFVRLYSEGETRENIRVLSNNMAVYIRRVISLVGSLPEEVGHFEKALFAFGEPMSSIKGIYSSRSSHFTSLQNEADSLEQLFNELGVSIKSLEPELQDFQSLMDTIRETLRSAGLASITVFSLLDRQDKIVSGLTSK